MSDTPLYDATLAGQLQRARRDGELARARWTLAERAAGERASEAERLARLAIARAERAAAQQVAQVRAEADRTVAKARADAHRTVAQARAEADRAVAHAQREARLRQALVAEETEERVRAALAGSAPALPPLRIDLDGARDIDRERDLEGAQGLDAEIDLDVEPWERDAPPVPSMEELMRPVPGVNRFLDSLLGLSDR